LLVDTDVDLAPDASFGADMLAGVPLAFPFNLDAGAVRCPAVVYLQTMEGIRRCSGPFEPRYGMLTASVLCRRQMVLKSGTGQSRPFSRSRLSTKPVVWRSAIPKSTFMVKQVNNLELAIPEGIEPSTCRLEVGCSIQLSYGTAPGVFCGVGGRLASRLRVKEWKNLNFPA
jgi:hypothetical protein